MPGDCADAYNIIDVLSRAETGHRLIREVPVESFRLASTGAVLTNVGTTHVVLDESQLIKFQSDAGATAAVWAIFDVPGDYEPSLDVLKLRLMARMDGDTDTPLITATGSKLGVGQAAAAFTVTDTVEIIGTTLAVYELDLSGNRLQPGQQAVVILTPEAHATNSMLVYAGVFQYAGNLALTTQSQR